MQMPAGHTLPGLKKVLSKGPERTSQEHSLLSDELAVHSDQPEVHLEQVLEHAQLLPQVPLALCAVSADGDEQALSELQAQRAPISRHQGTPSWALTPGGSRGGSGPRGLGETQFLPSEGVSSSRSGEGGVWTARGAEEKGTQAPGPHTHQVEDIQAAAVFC